MKRVFVESGVVFWAGLFCATGAVCAAEFTAAEQRKLDAVIERFQLPESSPKLHYSAADREDCLYDAENHTVEVSRRALGVAGNDYLVRCLAPALSLSKYDANEPEWLEKIGETHGWVVRAGEAVEVVAAEGLTLPMGRVLWSSIAGGELIRQYEAGTPVSIAQNGRSIASSTAESLSDSARSLLWSPTKP